MPSTVGGVTVPTPTWKIQLQFNWFTDGFQEIYYHSGGDLNAVSLLVHNPKVTVVDLVSARYQLLQNNDNLYIYAARVSPAGGGAVGTTLLRGPWKGSYTMEPASTTGPWDAADLYFPMSGGTKRVQEMRGIPSSVANFFGGNNTPGSKWLDQLPVFQNWLAGNGFGIPSSAIQPTTPTFVVTSIVPNVGTPLPHPDLPPGVLVVTAPGSAIPANTSQKIKFSQVRTRPRLNPSHVAIGIDGTNTFYLKNTDVGSIQYQPSSGKVFLAAPTFQAFVPTSTAKAFLSKSGSKKPGRAFGGTSGRSRRSL